MSYGYFCEYFPEIGKRETRSITIPKRLPSGLPAGEYGFLEMYCDERGCDCRRVFLCVTSPSSEEPLAVIGYGWENAEYYARWIGAAGYEMGEEMTGPSLNMMSRQSNLAPALLELVKDVLLQDEA